MDKLLLIFVVFLKSTLEKGLGCFQQTLMEEGQTDNYNVTSSGYQMKFWVLLAMVAHIENTTQQNHKDNTTNHNVPIQRGNLSLILVDQGQVYNSNHKPQWLTNETLGFNWDGRMYSMHNITKISDWLIFLDKAFSLVTMLMSISQSLHDLSQQGERREVRLLEFVKVRVRQRSQIWDTMTRTGRTRLVCQA